MDLKDESLPHEGKNVLITGASGELGRLVVLSFAKSNVSSLIITGRNKAELTDIVMECKELGKRVECVSCDLLSDPVDGLVSLVESMMGGKLDVLVGAHGTTSNGDFKHVMDVNFTSMVRLTNSLTRLMNKNGSIVFVTGRQIPGSRNTAYCCSKAALAMFTKCTALDLGKRQIRVNAVSPLLGETEARKGPLGRGPSIQGVVNAIMFLASDLALDITGTELVVDCGQSLMHGNT